MCEWLLVGGNLSQLRASGHSKLKFCNILKQESLTLWQSGLHGPIRVRAGSEVWRVGGRLTHIGTWTLHRKNNNSVEQPYWINGRKVSRPALASPCQQRIRPELAYQLSTCRWCPMKLGIPVELYWLHNSNFIGSHFSSFLVPDSAMLALLGRLPISSHRRCQKTILVEIIVSMESFQTRIRREDNWTIQRVGSHEVMMIMEDAGNIFTNHNFTMGVTIRSPFRSQLCIWNLILFI